MLGEPRSLSCYLRHEGLVADLNINFARGGLGKVHLDLTTPLRCEWEIVGEDGAVDWKRHRDVDYDLNDMYRAEAAHFLACIRGEAKPLTDGWDGRETLMVCDAAQRSAKEGRWIAR